MQRETAKAPRQKYSWQVGGSDLLPESAEESKPGGMRSGGENRKGGNAAMEILFSQFIGKPLNIIKQESNTT